jgi:hypothetical protein
VTAHASRSPAPPSPTTSSCSRACADDGDMVHGPVRTATRANVGGQRPNRNLGGWPDSTRFLSRNPLRASIRSSAGKRDPGLLADWNTEDTKYSCRPTAPENDGQIGSKRSRCLYLLAMYSVVLI